MRTSFGKIALILAVVIVLPISALLIFEIRSLNDNVAMMEAIYSKQIETFLFSINQYSDDVVSSMNTRVEDAWLSKGENEFPRDILQNYPGVEGIVFFPLEKGRLPTMLTKTTLLDDSLRSQLTRHLEADSLMIKKLIEYREAGFRKVGPYQTVAANGETFNTLLMVLGDSARRHTLSVILIRPADFITELLAPKMQQVAGEEFVISAVHRPSGNLVFTTDSLLVNKALSKEIWLLPEYDLEMYVPGNSLETIAKERTNTNMLLIGTVAFVLVLGFMLLFRSIRTEMNLAQTKSDFVSNVSHEIRTPLSLISMFGETLLMDRVPSEAKKKEYYEIIVKETSRLTNIVNKILNFSQIEANKKTYKLEAASMSDITREVLHTYSFHLENKGFAYSVSLGEDLPKILADKESVMEALINLLDNAMKYSTDTKEIAVSTEKDGDYVVVAVSDKGVGIEAKKIKQIFDKFYRVTQGDIYHTQGTGLGLSIVKHIMDAHSGQVTVSSTPGKGSTFKLMFPILVR